MNFKVASSEGINMYLAQIPRFIIDSFLLIAFNARKITNDFKEKIPITIYLKNEAKKIEIEQLIKNLILKTTPTQ